jgi:hypothetical protein
MLLNKRLIANRFLSHCGNGDGALRGSKGAAGALAGAVLDRLTSGPARLPT